MIKHEGLNGRTQLARELVNKFVAKTASSVTFIQARCGQGKSYIVDCIIKELEDIWDIKVYCNQDDEIISPTDNAVIKSRYLNSLSATGGNSIFSLGIGIGWENSYSNYNKIRNLLSTKLRNNILICIENISDVSDELRFLTTCIIQNVQELEKEFKKKIFLLITDTQDIYIDVIHKYTSSCERILLPSYSINDTRDFLIQRGVIHDISTENLSRIFELSQGNLDLADFLYEEFLVNENEYISTLQDVVAKRISIIKSQGEKHDISGKKMEAIVFSASLALKDFSAQFLREIVEERITDVEDGLEIAKNEALLEKDFKKYYSFISTDIQNYIAKMTIERHESFLITYYNFYTLNEQDEYYFRAYYIYKYVGHISSLSFSLFILSYSVARKMSDDLKMRKIENILTTDSVEENYKKAFDVIRDYYDSLFEQLPLTDITQKYKNIKKYDWELPVKAELTCEYFHYIYRNTKMNTPMYRNVLNDCINYAMNELTIDTSDIGIIEPVDETVLRLKIIYEISPCVLDQLNDYDEFNHLYHKSQELSISNNIRQHGIGKYVENVFNRKAFLFANQVACSIYYEKAKKYFASNEIWIEYYITLVCQAGTDIVIQEFDEAIELCNRAESESSKRDIIIPQIEKLYNNRIIAEFLLAEQDAKTPQKAISFAKKAIKKLKDLLTGEKNASQFVIYTNICSLYLYSNNDKQYVTYKRKLEKLYDCKDIANIKDESIDDFYRYYFFWFELYRKINNCNWEDAWHYINQLDNFIPALFRKQEIFWDEKNKAVKQIINTKETINTYDFCHNLVKTKRNEQVLSKFFYRGLMLSDLQYTSYF